MGEDTTYHPLPFKEKKETQDHIPKKWKLWDTENTQSILKEKKILPV